MAMCGYGNQELLITKIFVRCLGWLVAVSDLFIQTFAYTHLLRSEGKVFSLVCLGTCAALMHVRFDAR